jgi:secreted trypsin-like serine protease
MKNVVFIFLFCFIQLNLFSQKVTVKIVRAEDAAVSDWLILDDRYQLVFKGSEYYRSDSVILTLDANKRYFLEISVSKIVTNDTKLYTLILNNEPIILINTDIGTGDHFYPFFTGIKNEENKITGGTTTTISEFPWQVYYISGNFRCGGTIISKDWILTAAHCTKNSFGVTTPLANMFVKAGANNPNNSSDGQLYNVSEVIVHEGYDTQTLENDIALLRLQQPINIPTAKPIKLITSEDVAFGATDPGVMSWVTGWGLTQVNPNVTPVNLQKVQLPIVTNKQASTVWNSIPSTCIMAGYQNGNQDACSGDSGGPLVVPVFDEYKIAGIVSWGSATCSTYGGYTRVSMMETWIRSKTGITKEITPPVPAGDTLVCAGVASGQYSVNPISNATAYEWKISPAEAGVVTWNNEIATVTWTSGFVGSATLTLRATINGVVSEWSRLTVKVVYTTKLNSQSADTAVCTGTPISLYVGANGYNNNYKWFRDNVLIQSGTSPEVFFRTPRTDNSGIYKCQIAGYCNTVISDNVKLTVYPLTEVTSVSPNLSVPFGSDATLEVNSLGHNLAYQWKKDGVTIENSNLPKLYLYNLNASDIGLYNSIVTGTCGTVVSDSVYVYVMNKNSSVQPEVFLWPSFTTGNFNIALSNDATYSVSIYTISGSLAKEIKNCRFQTTINVSNLSSGTYIVRIISGEFHKSLRFIRQ